MPTLHPTRRNFLKAGGISLFAGDFPPTLSGRETAPKLRTPRIKSCLILFQAGGVSQIDTVDMRPDGPENVRGEFKPIASRVAGMPVCEHLPMLAQQMDKVCVVRSMYHRMLCHNPACYCALSGRDVGESKAVSNQTPATPDDYPNFGSVVSMYRPAITGLPSFVSLPFLLFNGPAQTPGQNAGLLGSRYDPFLVEKDPSQPGYEIDELQQRAGINARRLGDRRSLQRSYNALQTTLAGTRDSSRLNVYYRRALSMLNTPRSRTAFDLAREDQATRDRYGMNVVGQSTLLGRRLIGAGVPFVVVYSPVKRIEGLSWDTHTQNFPKLKENLLPPADMSLSALLEDMDQRGMLAETLVIWMGEFGRTPRIGYTQSNNTSNQTGRDHHPYCYSIVLAGAGVTPGSYFGASDKDGWYPHSSPVHPGDLAATLYDAFGIDPRQTIYDTLGRPHRLCEGHVVPGLF
ncbi:MAG: DUF1501 domain-containing protein [Planctomycetota bacterium]|nr:DUF1501 domain-containing protein [Planctomycetota bacterium]